MEDPLNKPCPSSVHKVSINPESFYGDKYHVEKANRVSPLIHHTIVF